jgi:hypothetical protein
LAAVWGQFYVAKVVAFKKMLVIKQVEELVTALDEDGKFGARNEQLLPDPEHGAGKIVRPHDQLRRRFHLLRDPRQDVARSAQCTVSFSGDG